MSSSLDLDVGCLPIEHLIRSSENCLKWFPYSELQDVKLIKNSTLYYATLRDEVEIILFLLGSGDKCTQEFIDECARVYTIPTPEHLPVTEQFRRHSALLRKRNSWIKGFTKYKDDYCLVADYEFRYCYSLYGFCSACGLFRCSPVWCVCGHKELSSGWTNEDEKLEEFIKKSQRQTKSANDAYLEWIPYDWVSSPDRTNMDQRSTARLHTLPVWSEIELLYLSDKNYPELFKHYPDMLCANIWITLGFTYIPPRKKYALIRTMNQDGICLACAGYLLSITKEFCNKCKAPRPLDWTTGNKSLDLFIMESWNNTTNQLSGYIRWIEFSRLTNVQQTPGLDYRCTHTADWSESEDSLIKVMMKKIVDGQNAQSYDFYRLIEDYPRILTPDNVSIIGITRDPSTQDYFLLFYADIRTVLAKVMKMMNLRFYKFEDFDEIEEVGSGGYGTIYSAKFRLNRYPLKGRVALKLFKSSEQMPEIFISEFRNHSMCTRNVLSKFLGIYGVTQQTETKEYMIVMQFANGGNLLSYLDRNIHQMTWKIKAEYLRKIADRLTTIHKMGLIHCDLHGGNIVLNSEKVNNLCEPLICDLGLSKSSKSRSSTIQGVLPYIAPETLYTRQCTQKSDVYAFGILMYLTATGEPPFRDYASDEFLATRICRGLRPVMPDSAPEPYKRLAETCWDADPDKRPTAKKIFKQLGKLIDGANEDTASDNVWNTIYYNDNRRPLTRIEKETKYSSKVLPVGNFPMPSNSRDVSVVQEFVISDEKQIDLVLPDNI